MNINNNFNNISVFKDKNFTYITAYLKNQLKENIVLDNKKIYLKNNDFIYNFFSKLTKKYHFNNQNILFLCDNNNQTTCFYKTIAKKCNLKFLKLTHKFKFPIKFNYTPFEKLSFRRILISVAANEKYKLESSKIIILDFDELITTFNIILNNTFIGGLILPSFYKYKNTLKIKSSFLPRIHFNKLPNLISNEYQFEKIAGTYNSYYLLLNTIYDKITNEININPKEMLNIITGKNASNFLSLLDFSSVYDKDLLISGMNIILNYNLHNKT